MHGRTAGFLALLTWSLALSAGGAAAAKSQVSLTPESTEVMAAPMPTGRSSASAVWDGQFAYLFGGFDGSLSREILRYDPELDAFRSMGGQLPTGRSATSAAWDGNYAYVFGGFAGLLSNQIVRYDPAADVTTTLSAVLPKARSETAAVWADSVAYVIGGFDGALVEEIVRFDPAANSVSVMNARVQPGRSGATAVWTGEHVYIFGGSQGGQQILRFDPEADEVTIMNGQLPTARYRAAATWDGRFAYVFGGNDGSQLNQIVRYDPLEDKATQIGLTLPYGRSEAAAVAAGYTSYVFGGCCDGANLLRDVVSVVSANAVPVPDFVAVRDGLTVSVDAVEALDPDGQIVEFSWDWGDGSAPTLGVKASHKYASAGTKLVALTITDNRGLKSSVHLEVPLVASATGSTQPAILPYIPLPRPSDNVAPATSSAPPVQWVEGDPEDEMEVGGDDASDRASGSREAPKNFAARIAHALSDSWADAPGLWVSLSLMVGTGCAVAAIFLFRLSAAGRKPHRATVRPKPPSRP